MQQQVLHLWDRRQFACIGRWLYVAAWNRAPTPRGLAPDVIHLGDRYYLYIAANIGAQPKAAINLLANKTLNPDSPDYKWEEGGVVASSDGIEDCNA
ncbi:MAG: hypothetical protein M3Z85_01455, partial [Acidobacteriota bacterium]|nr:hypothetical protein [Acidobacteriota bacterium]